MALTGTLVGPAVRLSTDGGGVPVIASDEPEAPDGFRAVPSFEGRGGCIEQVWNIVPDGAHMDAVTLASMLAVSVPDGVALKVPQLIRSWYVGEALYSALDRVSWRGDLYRCLQTHAPRVGLEPDTATHLWERI